MCVSASHCFHPLATKIIQLYMHGHLSACVHACVIFRHVCMHTFQVRIKVVQRLGGDTVKHPLYSFALGCNRSHGTGSTEKNMLVVLQFGRLAVGHVETTEAQRCRVQHQAKAPVPYICSISVSIGAGISTSVKTGVGALLKIQKYHLKILKKQENKGSVPVTLSPSVV